MAIMVATTEADAAVAAMIRLRPHGAPIMTAGLLIGERSLSAPRWQGLRPHARVLMVGGDERDVVDLLTALRA